MSIDRDTATDRSASAEGDEPDIEAFALRDMLDDARAELAAVRQALGVACEPHQSLQERTLLAATNVQSKGTGELEQRKRDYARALDAIKGHVEYISLLEQKLRELQAFKDGVELHQRGGSNSWYWLDDRENYLETMVASLPVVIRAEQLRKLLATSQAPAPAHPIDMVLHCPACGEQHIDEPEWRDSTGAFGTRKSEQTWSNPPHRSHLCHGCGHVWRPADVPTNGVAAVQTRGKADSPIRAPAVGAEEQELRHG